MVASIQFCAVAKNTFTTYYRNLNMDVIKELVFLVGACAILRSEVKNGITDIEKRQKSKAINMFDETIETALGLLRKGFPPEEEDAKKEIIESLFALSAEMEKKIRDSHHELSGQNTLEDNQTPLNS